MSFLAESLVDEWLNRRGYFTVRGIKHGVSEIDLLGVKASDGAQDCCHVEVQASFRPVGYITPIAKEQLQGFAKSRTSAKQRPGEILELSVADWVHKKFTSKSKQVARHNAWPGLNWRFVFVHAVVREPRELELIESHGIEVISFHQVLSQLDHASAGLRGGAGTDISEIVEYFFGHKPT